MSDPLQPDPSRPAPTPANLDADFGSEVLARGTRLGEFEVTGLIGQGGFGIVYLAWDHQLEREVAVKEYMPSSLAARTQSLRVAVKSERQAETFATGLRSFVNEARLLARFDHPALVKVHRFWEDNGTAYMAMPYYQGKTLRAALADLGGPPDEAWLKAMLGPILEALETIHAANVFHRDVAPDNIMILSSGRPLLLDFGAARRVIGDMTHALTVILKPGYAPVEQYAEGPEMRQGGWTDVYALAAVVYYCITGRAPVPSVSRMMKDTLVPAREAGRGRYSESFLAAVDRALAVQIDDRTQSVAEFRAELGIPAPEGNGPFAASTATMFGPGIAPTMALPDGAAAIGSAAIGSAAIGSAAIGSAAIGSANARPGSAAPAPATRFPVTGGPLPEDERTQPLPATTLTGAGAAAAGRPVTGGAVAGGPVAGPAAALSDRERASTPQPGARGIPTGAKIGVALVLVAAFAVGGWFVLGSSAPESRTPAPSAGGTAPDPAPPRASGSSADAPSPQPRPAPGAPTSSPTASPAAPVAPSAPEVMQDLAALADPQWPVELLADPAIVRIGRDRIRFKVRSARAGYLYVLMMGSASPDLYLLFPNAIDAKNRLDAGATLQLPRQSWEMVAEGPPGVDRILAIVSPTPRDFTSAGLRPDGRFDLGLAAGVAAAQGRRALAGTPRDCAGPADGCERFGAARLEIRVVE